jgi:hypothetical protein
MPAAPGRKQGAVPGVLHRGPLLASGALLQAFAVPSDSSSTVGRDPSGNTAFEVRVLVIPRRWSRVGKSEFLENEAGLASALG